MDCTEVFINPQQGNAPDLIKQMVEARASAVEYEKRRDACFTAMAGIAEPAQWVKAVEELEVEINHYISCGKRIYDCPICSGAFEISLAKLQSARGGKE